MAIKNATIAPLPIQVHFFSLLANLDSNSTLPIQGFAKSLSLDTYTVTPKTNFARHTAENNTKITAVLPKGATSQDAPPTFTFVFPSNGVTVTDVMWYMYA